MEKNSSMEDSILIEEKDRYVYTNDDILKLPQRDLFRDRLKQSVAFARRHSFKVAILAIDLDTFSDDVSSITDKILKRIGKRIVKTLRETDTISSQGVDEFVILLPDIKTDEDITIVSNKIVTALAKSFKIEGKEIYIEPYIGVAIYPDDGTTAEEVLTKANIAMVEAKAQEKYIYRIGPEVKVL